VTKDVRRAELPRDFGSLISEPRSRCLGLGVVACQFSTEILLGVGRGSRRSSILGQV